MPFLSLSLSRSLPLSSQGDINKIVEAMKEARKNLTHLSSKPDYTEQVDLYRCAGAQPPELPALLSCAAPSLLFLCAAFGHRTVTKMEAESAEFYKARAEIAQDPALRKLLETIAAEEVRHYRLLNGLLQFVSEDDECREMEQPNFWVGLFFCVAVCASIRGPCL